MVDRQFSRLSHTGRDPLDQAFIAAVSPVRGQLSRVETPDEPTTDPITSA